MIEICEIILLLMKEIFERKANNISNNNENNINNIIMTIIQL